MKTLGLIVVLALGILVVTLSIIPLNVQTDVETYSDVQVVTLGQERVGQITITNTGWFTRRVTLPELVGCVGDKEVPLDSWTVAQNGVVRGVGQIPYIQVAPGEEGVVYIIASEHHPEETLKIYYRTPYFSCLTPGTPA